MYTVFNIHCLVKANVLHIWCRICISVTLAPVTRCAVRNTHLETPKCSFFTKTGRAGVKGPGFCYFKHRQMRSAMLVIAVRIACCRYCISP